MDLRLSAPLLAGLLAFAASAPASAQMGAPADASTEARAFVTVRYFEGIPYDRARALGPDVLPDLYAVLDDPDLAPYWANTVGTIGYLASPSSVEPLLAFLRGFEGDVSVHAFQAALQVMPALGHIHHAGSEEAFGVLVAFANDGHWRRAGLGLRYGRYEGAALGEVLGRMAILGLGVAGTPEAAVHLDALRSDALRADWIDNVDEAQALNARIRSEGVEAVLQPTRDL